MSSPWYYLTLSVGGEVTREQISRIERSLYADGQTSVNSSIREDVEGEFGSSRMSLTTKSRDPDLADLEGTLIEERMDASVEVSSDELDFHQTRSRYKNGEWVSFYYDGIYATATETELEEAILEDSVQQLLDDMRFCRSDVPDVRVLESSRELLALQSNNATGPDTKVVADKST